MLDLSLFYFLWYFQYCSQIEPRYIPQMEAVNDPKDDAHPSYLKPAGPYRASNIDSMWYKSENEVNENGGYKVDKEDLA